MLLYIGCHSPALLRQLVDGFPTGFFPASHSLCVCSGGQWHSSKWAPVVCRVISPTAPNIFCMRCCGLCHRAGGELGDEASTQVHKQEVKLRAGFSNKQATRERRSWGGRGVDWDKEQPRMRWGGRSDHPFWKSERGACKLYRPSRCTVHEGCHETELSGVYLIMPCRPRPSVSNLTLQRLITV